MNASGSSLIVPIAHYVGQEYESADVPPTFNLRGGWSIVNLTEDERAIWAFAHGVPEHVGSGRPWNREALKQAAAPHFKGGDIDDMIENLIARKVLAEFTPGTDQAIEFARQYRLVPLQVGLGNTLDEPRAWRIGIGDNVLLTVSSTVYRAWEWCHLYRSLWDFCQKFAKIRAEHTDPPARAEDQNPEQILAQVLESLQSLIAASCAYLDVPHEWGTS